MTQATRIAPADPQGRAQNLFAAIKDKLGSVPNIFATMAHSPAVLEGYLAFSEALGKGALSPALREQIALTVAGRSGCDYCASAHTLLARSAGVSEADARRSLSGIATDAHTAAALSFAALVVEQRGRISMQDLTALRRANFTDEEIVEIVAHVSTNIFTNYFNHITGTEIDFPLVKTEGISAAA